MTGIGVFDWIFTSLAGERQKPAHIVIDSAHLKALRTPKRWQPHRHSMLRKMTLVRYPAVSPVSL